MENKYLIQVGTEAFTKVDGVVESLGEVEISSDLFINSGFDEIPTNDDLANLSNPQILVWNETDIPKIKGTITASPSEIQQVITSKIDLTHSTIKGIEKVTADCDGELIIAVSFDEKKSWKAWSGSSWAELSDTASAMSKDTLEAITVDQWNELYEGASGMYIRLTFTDISQVVRQIYVDFAN